MEIADRLFAEVGQIAEIGFFYRCRRGRAKYLIGLAVAVELPFVEFLFACFRRGRVNFFALARKVVSVAVTELARDDFTPAVFVTRPDGAGNVFTALGERFPSETRRNAAKASIFMPV